MVFDVGSSAFDSSSLPQGIGAEKHSVILPPDIVAMTPGSVQEGVQGEVHACLTRSDLCDAQCDMKNCTRGDAFNARMDGVNAGENVPIGYSLRSGIEVIVQKK